MAKIKITDECVACGACQTMCPVMAISLAKSGDKYEIDNEKCVACYTCVNACPVSAIIEEPETKK